MSVSVNIPEELHDQARAIAEAQNIAVEDVFASAVADYSGDMAAHPKTGCVWRIARSVELFSNTCRTRAGKLSPA